LGLGLYQGIFRNYSAKDLGRVMLLFLFFSFYLNFDYQINLMFNKLFSLKKVEIIDIVSYKNLISNISH
jgi:hypothetical protein